MARAIRGRMLASLWLLLLPLQVVALSMGDMVVQSVPGEPLRAHIPLALMAGEALPEVRITLATPEEYAQRQIPRAGMLQGLRLALLDKGEGHARLQLFGEQPWQGEGAQLLFMISLSSQPLRQMERQYQLAAVTPDLESTPIYVEVAKNETLDEIAIRLSKGRNRSYLHMMYALFLANPDAFYRGNMNNLKSGSTLRVPSAAELYRLSDHEVFDGIRQQYAQWLQLRDSTAQQGTPAGEALAGMSNEQAAGLDLSANPAALQQRLQQVAAESEAMRQENEVLQQRLKALELRMQSVAGQVLDYADSGAPVAAPPVSPTKTEAASGPQTAPGKGEAGLSASAMFAAIVLVVLFVIYIWYTTGHPRRGRP